MPLYTLAYVFWLIAKELPNKKRVAQCMSCNSNGEIDEEKIDSMYVDADGIHRLH